MPQPIASLSLDLDNKWSYLKTHGDRGWDEYPSYLDTVVPRFLDLLADLGLRITVFVVGQDAARAAHHAALKRIATAGHEIGNHSFHHEPWLHLYSPEQVDTELADAEDAILSATGVRPIGFRGPGYSLSPAVVECLLRRGYQYDASSLPTLIGPLARAYYFLTARLTADQRQQRKRLFGGWSEGLKPIRPYWWQVLQGEEDRLLEIPVTTFPFFRVPIHFSYLLYLRQFSQAAAWSYWKAALSACRLTGVEPSLLLHPLDLLGGDEEPDLDFFPAMRMSGATKRAFVRDMLANFSARFTVVPMAEHAARIAQRDGLPVKKPTTRATQDHFPVATTAFEPALTAEGSRQ